MNWVSPVIDKTQGDRTWQMVLSGRRWSDERVCVLALALPPTAYSMLTKPRSVCVFQNQGTLYRHTRKEATASRLTDSKDAHILIS